jgi:hypothetical protein
MFSPMSLRRVLALSAISAMLVTSLTACFDGLLGLPNLGNGGSESFDYDAALAGTSWSGRDSDGDSWEMTFTEDGTVDVELNGRFYDDATDVWIVSGGQITISIVLNSGEALFVGDYDGPNLSIDLDATLTGHSFTLTLERTGWRAFDPRRF